GLAILAACRPESGNRRPATAGRPRLACIHPLHPAEFPAHSGSLSFMSLIALGINHRTAPVDIRERVAFPPERLGDALRELACLPQVREAAILSTCNRT